MMRRWNTIAFLAVFCAGAASLLFYVLFRMERMREAAPELTPVAYSDVGGWDGDDHAAAFAAFRRSCERITDVEKARGEAGGGGHKPHRLANVCRKALVLGTLTDGAEAREFFEIHFTPHRLPGEKLSGFVTGYYEPELKGSRSRSARFSVPVYRVPDDLVQLFPDSERARRNHEMTAGRTTAEGIVPYYDRKEIEQGALEGRSLEILWLDDWADAFYMHVQGSGRVALEEGGHVRLAYAAKNGHSYTAIGKLLIERGEIAPEKMSMLAVREWLEENPSKARELMWENRSFIFFRELSETEAVLGPSGAQGVALTPLRSLAVDTSIHALGTPVWVNAPELDVHGRHGFARLMIAQDAGSAIRGAMRGDIFWGSGPAAGDLAGATRHAAEFTVLIPKGDRPES